MRSISIPKKYQFKERDWNAPGNIKDWIARINQIRKQNRALQMYSQPALLSRR